MAYTHTQTYIHTLKDIYSTSKTHTQPQHTKTTNKKKQKKKKVDKEIIISMAKVTKNYRTQKTKYLRYRAHIK